MRLLQCLFAVFKMEVSSFTAEAMLSGVRKLFRDPHSFTSKLCSMPPFSTEEAKKLAPFLTSGSQFRRVREKEVNECHDALHTWLSAFYTYSSVSDQVAVTLHQLEGQELLLHRLNNQDLQSVPNTGGHLADSVPCGVALRSANSATGVAKNQPARAAASPLSRSRRALQGITATPGTRSGRARPENEGIASRSQSPAQAACNQGRVRVSQPVGSVAFGSSSVSRVIPTSIGRTGAGRQRADTAPVHGEGLGRVHSEKTLTKSPRTAGRRDSRSPSPGGRASPLAPLRTASRLSGPSFRGHRDGRPISPSEAAIPTAQRMVSAPTELASRSVARSTKGPATSARVNSNRHSATAPVGRPFAHSASAKTAARHGSPNKGAEVTPRTSHRIRLDDCAAKHCKDGNDDDSDGEDGGPYIRRLSEKQYEALVRCAQQVVALSGAGGAPRGPPG